MAESQHLQRSGMRAPLLGCSRAHAQLASHVCCSKRSGVSAPLRAALLGSPPLLLQGNPEIPGRDEGPSCRLGEALPRGDGRQNVRSPRPRWASYFILFNILKCDERINEARLPGPYVPFSVACA